MSTAPRESAPAEPHWWKRPAPDLCAVYLNEIRRSVAKRNTRAELRRMFFLHTGREFPKAMNLRKIVPEWWAQQLAINAGAAPGALWKTLNGLPLSHGKS